MPYLTTQEILCDKMATGDEEKYIKEIMPWIRRDAFNRVFLTSPDFKVWRSYIQLNLFD